VKFAFVGCNLFDIAILNQALGAGKWDPYHQALEGFDRSLPYLIESMAIFSFSRFISSHAYPSLKLVCSYKKTQKSWLQLFPFFRLIRL
jgi:hypothetical protein